LEAKWPWPGKFTFHFHGIPEERGAMGYFNVTDPAVDAIDGKDVAITKSISMIEWQDSLTKSLQKENPNGNVTTKNDEMTEMEEHRQEQPLSSQPSSDTNQVSIVRGATTLGDKSYLPNPLRIKVGSTVVWTNNDSTLHTVTSGTPNAENVGEAFDSGLTAFITPAKTYSNKFTNTGEFTYFCRVHPTMIGKIVVVP
jgi:nitrite reductase (NO-forming)